jgi:hypothetical protein
MTRSRLKFIGTLLVWCIAACLLVMCHGCALFQPCPVDAPAARMVDDYREFREGGLDEAETRMLDKDAGVVEDALTQKAQQWRPPVTGLPWLDVILALAGAAATVGTSVKATNVIRDRKRKKRGESVA